MEIIVPHHTTAEKAKEAVDRSSDTAYSKGSAGSSLELVDQKKSWAGPVMDFSLTAKAGLSRCRYRGTLTVDDANVTLHASFPRSRRHFVGEAKIQSAVEGRVREMLASPAGDS